MNQARIRFEQFLNRRYGQSSTPKHYSSDLKIFISVVGEKAPEEVTPEDIDSFVEHQIAAGMQPSTINRRLSSIHSFFEYLAGEDLARDWPNPVVSQRHHLKTGTHLPRDVSDADVARLLDVIDNERDAAMFGLMVGAGLRVGEVAALRLGDVETPNAPDQLGKLLVRGKGQRERVAWLTTSWWHTLDAWLQARPSTEDDHVFLNHHNRPISVAGIQYRLKEHCEAARITLSCHQLRHTFARRLAENGLPVDSIARLLGHRQLQTTQRYIDGADPTVRADFTKAMANLETTLAQDQAAPSVTTTTSLSPPRSASPEDLAKLRQRLVVLPAWLADAVDAYISWRWPTWRAQTALRNGQNLVSVMCRFWTWLDTHCQVDDWASIRRADLEAWLQARQQDGVSDVTIQNEMGQLRSLLKFMETRNCPIDPGLFRVRPPKRTPRRLPRHLSEPEYVQLERTVLGATEDTTYHAYFDRAWFLTLAHTGMRLSELLDLRLEDLNLEAGNLTIRDGKPNRDRVAFLTPPLVDALGHYLQQRSHHQRAGIPDEGYVFLLHGHSPAERTIQRRLASYAQQIELHVTPHQLRHTFATRLINQGVPIHSLRKLLGHQRLDTTLIYAHIHDDTLYHQFKDAMSHLEGIAIDDWPGVQIEQTECVDMFL